MPNWGNYRPLRPPGPWPAPIAGGEAPVPPREPLGLPRGSIRAILAIMVVAASLYMVATTGTLPEVLLGLVGVVIGYYFGSRGANGAR